MPKTKTAIANLASALRLFTPDCSLVNETGENKWNGKFIPNHPDAPNFDQFINTAAEAIPEIMEFIKEHDKLKGLWNALREDATRAHTILKVAGIDCDSLESGFEGLASRFHQSLDVITRFAYAKTIAADDIPRLQATFRAYVERFRPVSESDPKITPINEGEPNAGGSN